MTNALRISAFALISFLVLFAVATIAFAGVSFGVDTKENSYERFDFFSATTTAATSTNLSGGGGHFVIAGAKKVTFYFSHGGIATTSTATSTFKIQTSRDGTNWNDYYKLTSATSSATQQTIPIEGATSTVVASMSDIQTTAYYATRCIVVESAAGLTGASGDGEHTCIGAATF
jgi:propanediol dehydratase large subunit